MKEIYKDLNIIGADETGVGDYLTPLVACACFVPYKNVQKLKDLGVGDSKKNTDKGNLKLAKLIKPHVIYTIKHLTQKGYNKLNSTFNAHELKMFLHMGAINRIEEKVQNIDLIIIDQFSNKESIQKYYKKIGEAGFNFKEFKTKLKLVEKGESEHVSVAAASILARVHLLKMMTEQNAKYQMDFPLGTNKAVEVCAKDFVKKYGVKELKNVAKLSFKTTKKII